MEMLIQTEQASYLQQGQDRPYNYGKQNWGRKCPYHENVETLWHVWISRPAVTNNDKIVDSIVLRLHCGLFDGNSPMTFV